MSSDDSSLSEQLLGQAEAAFRSGRVGYRDAMVRVGRLLQDYVAARLREGDGLPEAARRKARACRSKATGDAARRLGTTNARVNELIRVAAAADLLSGGEPVVSLSYASLRCFRTVIYRPAKSLRCRRSRKDVSPGAEASDKARWEVRPEYAGRAEELFRTADAGGWPEKDVAQGIRSLRGEKVIDDDPPRVGKEFDPESMARNSSPRDLADWVARVIGLSSDPPAVMRLLEERLAAATRRWPSWGTYGEEDD